MDSFFETKKDIAIISCSSKKMKVPCPAYLMYSASPKFSQIYNYAITHYKEIVILSAKYGIISPNKIIEPYDLKLTDNLDPHFINEINDKLKKYENDTIYSYCSKLYNKHIQVPIIIIEGGMFDIARQLGKQRSTKGNVFPISKILEWVYNNSPCTKKSLYTFIKNNWTNNDTCELQYSRLLKCDFIEVKNNLIHYKFNL